VEALQAARAQYVEDRYGDIDDILDQPADEQFDAAGELVKTVPTTLAGMFAVLAYVEETSKPSSDAVGTFDQDKSELLLRTLAKAAKVLSKA